MIFPSNYSLEEIERILYLQNDLTCDLLIKLSQCIQYLEYKVQRLESENDDLQQELNHFYDLENQ